MRTNKVSIFVGVAVLALTVGLNVRHALNDYGVKTNKLHLEVLAQTSTTGGGSTSDGESMSGGGSTTGGGSNGYSCSASTNCYNWAGDVTGSVSCTGVIKCGRGTSLFGTPYVKCDGLETSC